jgi:hypothetical protein
MRFVILKNEKSISDLAARLFSIKGRGSQAATKLAADALLKANPQLADLSMVSAGSIVAIPDHAPAISADEEVIEPGAMRSLTVQMVQTAINGLHQRLTEIENTAANRLRSAASGVPAANSKSPTNVSGLNAELAKYLPSSDSIAKDTASFLKNVQQVQDSPKASLTQLNAALVSFARK